MEHTCLKSFFILICWSSDHVNISYQCIVYMNTAFRSGNLTFFWDKQITCWSYFAPWVSSSEPSKNTYFDINNHNRKILYITFIVLVYINLFLSFQIEDFETSITHFSFFFLSSKQSLKVKYLRSIY